MVEGALEATRKDNSRLQSEVASLRSTLRRGMALERAAGRAWTNRQTTRRSSRPRLGKNAESA